jgi:hypothetical protein
MRREIAVTACVPMTCRGVLRRFGFVTAGLRGLRCCRAERAQENIGLRIGSRAGGKRLGHRRSECGHQDREQSNKAAELADEATAHEADVDLQSG